jgi:hypothetical protein
MFWWGYTRERGHLGDQAVVTIIIIIQPLGRFWQEPEPIQVTGMALAHCILGKFLGVVCHCFPLPLDVPTFAARCLYVPNASAPIGERWNCGRILLRWIFMKRNVGVCIGVG